MNTQEKIAELERQLAEIKLSLRSEEEWPKIGDSYWVIPIQPINYGNDKIDEFNKISDNMFRTKKEAEYHIEMLKLAYSIRQKALALDEIDWSIEKLKYFMSYDGSHIERSVEGTYNIQYSRTNFKTQEECEEAFKGVSDKDFLYMLYKGMI